MSNLAEMGQVQMLLRKEKTDSYSPYTEIQAEVCAAIHDQWDVKTNSRAEEQQIPTSFIAVTALLVGYAIGLKMEANSTMGFQK